MRIRTVRWGLSLLAGIWLATAAEAGLADGWRQSLAQTAEDLEAGKYRSAEVRLQDLLRQMGQRADAETAAGDLVAEAVLYLALAEEGLGKADDAVWHWHVAVAIHPPIEKTDLSRFGAPGERLGNDPPPEADTAAFPLAAVGAPDPEEARKRNVEPPRVEKVPIRYPPGARRLKQKGQLVARLIIGKDGQVSHPTVLAPLPAPMLTLTALEGIRKWHYEPAKQDGRPMAVYYHLTLLYGL